MDNNQIMLLIGLAFAGLALASHAPEEEEFESDANCYPAFDKSFTEEFVKAAQDCQYKPMKKIKWWRLQTFKSFKNGKWNLSMFAQSKNAISYVLLFLSASPSGSNLCH